MRSRLVRDKRHAEHALRFFAQIVERFHDLDTAALAAAAGVNLRLHHPNGTTQSLGSSHRFIDAECGNTARHRHTKAAQNLLGLVFVDVHASLASGRTRELERFPATRKGEKGASPSLKQTIRCHPGAPSRQRYPEPSPPPPSQLARERSTEWALATRPTQTLPR